MGITDGHPEHFGDHEMRVRDGRDGCRQCGGYVYDPFDNEYCDRCSDILIERMQQGREWEEFHPGTPCPDVELTPLPSVLEVTKDE